MDSWNGPPAVLDVDCEAEIRAALRGGGFADLTETVCWYCRRLVTLRISRPVPMVWVARCVECKREQEAAAGALQAVRGWLEGGCGGK
jgi:hypothetical protein